VKRFFGILLVVIMAITLCSCVYPNLRNEPRYVTAQELLKYVNSNDTGVTEADFEGLDIDDFISFSHIYFTSHRTSDLKQLLDNYSARLSIEDLLQYIKENDTGLTEEDFAGVDIDGFINDLRLTNDRVAGYDLKQQLESYRARALSKKFDEIMAKEKKRVNSTDEEYEAFIEAFFSAVGGEVRDSGTVDKLDAYSIVATDEWFSIGIGKTKNINKYTLRHDRSTGNYEIVFPAGEMYDHLRFYYSSDGKFFLVVYLCIDHDFEYELCELFTQVRPE